MEQRYFKVTNNFYGGLIEGVYPLHEERNGGYAIRVNTSYGGRTQELFFRPDIVKEVFNYNPIPDKVETVSDQVFSNKTHLDNYDSALDSKGERWMEETESLVGKRVFESGSMRDNDDNKPLPFELHPYMLLRYGYHMKTGSLNYGKGNWEKTQPDADLWDSGGRHFAQAMLCFKDPELAKELGLDQEDHLSALLFFVNMLMMNEAKRGIKPNHYFKGK